VFASIACLLSLERQVFKCAEDGLGTPYLLIKDGNDTNFTHGGGSLVELAHCLHMGISDFSGRGFK
jgi:hypothetical protein